jgi:hypothetical protein
LQSFRAINLAVRLALELGAVAALAYWGFETGGSTAASIALAIAAPAIMIVAWGAFVAPKSKYSLPKTAKWLLGLAILLIAAVALADAGSLTLAVIFGVIATINAALMAVWDQ